MQGRKILSLERDNFNLENTLTELKEVNRNYKKELESYHMHEETLKLRNQMSTRTCDSVKGGPVTIIIN
jgi:hypothetical protein